jgi:hypothetical protein
MGRGDGEAEAAGLSATFSALGSALLSAIAGAARFKSAVSSLVFASPVSFALSPVEVLRIFNPPRTSFSLPFLRFLAPTAQEVSPTVVSGAAAAASSSLAARSASSCALRNSSKCSLVCFFSASSFALARSCTESKNSISSSSRDLNWFVSRFDSSNASCLAAVVVNQPTPVSGSALRSRHGPKRVAALTAAPPTKARHDGFLLRANDPTEREREHQTPLFACSVS